MNNLLTIGDIARKLGIARTRLKYAIVKARIQEEVRAGILRLFSPDQIPVMEAALATVQARKNNDRQAERGDDE